MGHLLLEEFVYVFNMDGHEVDGIVVERLLLLLYLMRDMKYLFQSIVHNFLQSNYMGKDLTT